MRSIVRAIFIDDIFPPCALAAAASVRASNMA